MREYELIEKIIKDFPRSPQQYNKFLTCDAEIINIGKQALALTIDEFSPTEDFFTDDDPEKLGHNLVVATISDLYAAGSTPLFFMQSLTILQKIEDFFLDKLTRGIRNTLAEANCFLCGGDLSFSETWRYTGFALGNFPNQSTNTPKFLQRIIPVEPQILWITGTLGDANLAVITKNSTPYFELRDKEAILIKKYATSCIDTSGGLMDALFCLHQVSPRIAIELNLEKIPFTAQAKEQTHSLSFPKEALLVGGAGEYELLFTTPDTLSTVEKQELIAAGITLIGYTHPDKESKVITNKGFQKKQIAELPPCPRDIGSFAEYTKQVLDFTQKFLVYE